MNHEPQDADPVLAPNDPIVSGDLPQLATVDFEPLEPKYLQVRLALRIVPFLLGVAVTIGLVVADAPGWSIGLAVLITILVVSASAAAAVVETRRMGYAIRERDVSMRSGVLTTRTASIPHHRVQNVAVDRSAAARLAGLASVTISTAAGGSGRLTIPGLPVETAERLKELILSRSRLDDEE